MEREEFKALCRDADKELARVAEISPMIQEDGTPEARRFNYIIGGMMSSFAIAMSHNAGSDGKDISELPAAIAEAYIALTTTQLHFDISDEEIELEIRRLLTKE